MKTLTDYIENLQTDCFKKYGVFFAFSDKQFQEQKAAETVYVNISGAGCLCPKENRDNFLAEHDEIVKKGIAQDLAENGIDKIIERELNNYECTYSGDITDVVDTLSAYGVKPEQIKTIFNKMIN